MGLSADGSYVLVFFVTFLLVAAITLVSTKIFDTTASLPARQGLYGGAPPFPDAVPQIAPPSGDPLGSVKCVSYCTNRDDGQMEVCGSTKLRACKTEDDCAGCREQQPYQDLACMTPAESQWKHVAAQQDALNNKAEKYCLPQQKKCLVGKTLKKCRQNEDCGMCADVLSNSKAFTCKVLGPDAVINFDGQAFSAGADGGQFCVPAYRGCNPEYGVATWTSTGGWVCNCKYPGIYGGPQCDQLVACNADMVAPWSADKQQLLLNVPGEDGSRVGDPWSLKSRVDPSKCVDGEGKIVDCKPGLQRTVACRCDGIQRGTERTYTYQHGNVLTCKLDPCHGGKVGGRTWLWDATPGPGQDQLPVIPNQAATTCACSGYGSSAWKYENRADNADSLHYDWKGYCKDVRVPGTNITIKTEADATACKAVAQANTDAEHSMLVPAVDVHRQSVCVTDPCTGLSADTEYRVNMGELNALGHFNATTGKCQCGTNPVGSLAIDIPRDQCNRSENPVCGYCANACVNYPCEAAPGSNCGNMECSTKPDGSRYCKCGTDCVFFDGKCHQKKDNKACCEGYHGVDMGNGMNICGETKGGRCQLVRSSKTQPYCDVNSDWHAQAIVCSGHGQCGSCRNKDSCKGTSKQSFQPGCGINRDGSRHN